MWPTNHSLSRVGADWRPEATKTLRLGKLALEALMKVHDSLPNVRYITLGFKRFSLVFIKPCELHEPNTAHESLVTS